MARTSESAPRRDRNDGPETRSAADVTEVVPDQTVTDRSVRTKRRGRLRAPSWSVGRERWEDAGARWAFAGANRPPEDVQQRTRRMVEHPDRRGVVPEDVLPLPVQIVVTWALAALVVAWATRVVIDVLGAVAMVVIPLSVAVLLAAFLNPACRWAAETLRLPRALAAALSVLGLTAVLVAGSAVAGTQLAAGMRDMTARVTAGVEAIADWLRHGPLHVSNAQLDRYVGQIQDTLGANGSAISDNALRAGHTAVDVIAGTIVCLIATFFFLYDGRQIWTFLTRLLPSGARRPVFEAGRRGWVSLSAYARTQIVVATFDAVGIAGGALLLGLPLVAPLFFIVLVASVVPIVGAVVAGVVPVLIALVVEGPVTALAMLLIVLAVQQIEAHALQPFLMGRAVDLHPLAIIVAVTAATYLFGIPGALFAVPVLAFVNMAVRYLLGVDPFPEIGETRFVDPAEEEPGAEAATQE